MKGIQRDTKWLRRHKKTTTMTSKTTLMTNKTTIGDIELLQRENNDYEDKQNDTKRYYSHTHTLHCGSYNKEK